MPEIEETCETCRFYRRPPSRMQRGECRRYPHSLEKLLTEWCGEYSIHLPTAVPAGLTRDRIAVMSTPAQPVARVVP